MHQPLGGLGGTASEIKIQADLILSMKREMAELTAEQTGKSVEQIIADGDRDHWYTAPEALEYGFIDRIVTGAHDVTGGGGTAE
jgi:ATP-dependent Clp protease protease subunit